MARSAYPSGAAACPAGLGPAQVAQWVTMQQLQFTELDDHGRLVLEDGTGKRYALPVDDRVRAALRPRPVRAAEPGRQEASATPREVQAMIRAGQSAQEVATATS